MIVLRPYQTEALEAVLSSEAKGINKQLIVLPTGAGKTVIFSHLPIIRKESTPMLVIAHRAELLHQAKNKIQQMNPDLIVEIEQAENIAGKVDVVVASVPTMGRANSDRIEKFSKDYFKTIIIDEAHHAAAPTYRRIVDYFQPNLILGVTATPQRSDSTRLIDVFQEIVYYKTIEDLIKQGWLTRLVGYRIKTETDLTEIEVSDGDFVQSQLQDAVNNPNRNASIVAAYQQICQERKTLVFAAGVQHAKDLALSFTKNSIVTEVILGETPDEERSTILQKFRNNEIKVLINVGVLTEGFDEPSVQAIILARPTKSTLLYTQVVGRGTRLDEGKNNCLIIDISDTTKGKKPIGLPTLLGLPPDFDLNGQDLVDVAEEYKALEYLSPTRAMQCLSSEDINLQYKQVNLFMPVPPNKVVLQYSKLIWSEISDNLYRLTINNHESLSIYQDTLGRWTVEYYDVDKKYKQILGYQNDMRQAFVSSDVWIQDNRSSALALLDSNAAWRADGPTPAQTKFLKSRGIAITPEMTKGFASQIISNIIENDPQEKKKAEQRAYWKNKNSNKRW
jgi:superfamily II DNA or RNA helicase